MVLNNNYHAVHHDLPHVPWFALPRVYHARRADYLARNGGFLIKGYKEWLTNYALTPISRVVHPESANLPDTTRLYSGRLRHENGPPQERVDREGTAEVSAA